MRQAPEALARRARLPRNRVPDRGVRELRCPGRRAAPPGRPAPQARAEWTTPERPGLRERALLPLRLRRTPGRTAQPAIPRLRVASPAAARPVPTRVDRRPACLRVAARGHAVRASFTPTRVSAGPSPALLPQAGRRVVSNPACAGAIPRPSASRRASGWTLPSVIEATR